MDTKCAWERGAWNLQIWVVGLPRLRFMVAGLGWPSLLQLFGTWGGGVPVCTALSLSFREGASFNISWILRSIPLDVTVIWDIPVTRYRCKYHISITEAPVSLISSDIDPFPGHVKSFHKWYTEKYTCLSILSFTFSTFKVTFCKL